jgi:hypothetical protein
LGHWQSKSQRDGVPGNQTHWIGSFVALGKLGQDRRQGNYEEQRNHQAGDRQQRAPLVAQDILQDQPTKFHKPLPSLLSRTSGAQIDISSENYLKIA